MPEDTTTEETLDEDEDYTTASTRTRWEGLNTILSLLLILSLVAIVSFVVVTGTAVSALGQAWFVLYATIVLMAATWAFGKETLESVQKVRGK